MNKEDYNRIIDEYRSLRAEHGIDMRSIGQQLVHTLGKTIENKCNEWKESVVYSLMGFEFKSEIRCFTPKFNWHLFLNNSFHHYLNHKKSLIRLSEENHMSYAIVCQHILQYYHNWNKSTTKTLFANTSHISDGRLAFDVMLCNLKDIIFGNHSNHMTNNTGIVFESEISCCLQSHRISYMSEDMLRTDSFDVTPDFKLNLPIILKISKNNSNIYFIKINNYFDKEFTKLIETSDGSEFENVVITWIECKSMFASLVCHSQYYRNQYSSYINRFGNGLVLYKYGFVSDIPQEFKQNIIISDKFPQIIESN